MQYRSDLALELITEEKKGIEHISETRGDIVVDFVKIISEEGEKETGKPIGDYITFSVPALSDNIISDQANIEVIANELRKMLPNEGTVLVIGLGNTMITPDALGPESVKKILATRHIIEEFKRISGMEGLRSVSVIAPGVLGQTGMEVLEIVESIQEKIKFSAIIAIDALASGSLSRLGCTVQICNTGISPGAGVGNNRPGLNNKTMGVPVIAIGVPTVVDAETVVYEAAQRSNASSETTDMLLKKASPRGERMIITPREIDLIISRASRLISLAVNLALHPDYDPEELSNAV